MRTPRRGRYCPVRSKKPLVGESRTQLCIFDYLYMGEKPVDAGIDTADGFQYVLVILEDVSRYTWLQPSGACTANGTVEELVRWCATFGPPTTWVSDNATHFRKRVVRKLAKALGIDRRFSVANSAWT